MHNASSSIDFDQLARWLRPVLNGGALLDVERCMSGGSNEIFTLRHDDGVWVLKRPAVNPVDAEASRRIIEREYRVLQALDSTPVLHPHTVAFCDDVSVAGACFYVMEHLDGWTPDGPFPSPFDADASARQDFGYAMLDQLAALHCVDWRAVGLEGFGKPDGFLERQVDRWLAHLERNRTRDIPGIEQVASWLRENRPSDGPTAILHGDFQPHNTIFGRDRPVRMLGIVDWEQATIGDPLLDLGGLLAGWSDPGEPARFASYCTPREGLPTRAHLLERYAAATGFDVSHAAYHEVLASFKLACVLEGNFRLYVTGKSDRDVHRRMGDIVLGLARSSEATINGMA